MIDASLPVQSGPPGRPRGDRSGECGQVALALRSVNGGVLRTTPIIWLSLLQERHRYWYPWYHVGTDRARLPTPNQAQTTSRTPPMRAKNEARLEWSHPRCRGCFKRVRAAVPHVWPCATCSCVPSDCPFTTFATCPCCNDEALRSDEALQTPAHGAPLRWTGLRSRSRSRSLTTCSDRRQGQSAWPCVGMSGRSSGVGGKGWPGVRDGRGRDDAAVAAAARAVQAGQAALVVA
jgi:hypothetical protein